MQKIDYRSCLTTARPRISASGASRDLVEETESNRGRIIQSAALRRLQQKTQVYPLETNAAVRSRLTHSLEVQQTGRFIARTILAQLKERGELEAVGLAGIEIAFVNLVEMSCLTHDVGNPPFGHFGEAAFNEWLEGNATDCYADACGPNPTTLWSDVLRADLVHFEGNAQGLRILHSLQGLNLTYSQLGALLKYTRGAWQVPKAQSYCEKKPGFFYSEQSLVNELWQQTNLVSGCRHPLVYIMEAADDIAYCIADLEDAVDKEILSLPELKSYLTEEWQRLAGNEQWLLEVIERSAVGVDSAYGFITRLRTALVQRLVHYAAERYLEQHQAVFDGSLDQPLISGQTPEFWALETLRQVALKYVFCNLEKETPEIRGYTALHGMLNLFRPLLCLSKQGEGTLDIGDFQGSILASRLWHRLPDKYKSVYEASVAGLSEERLEHRRDLEWYYRVRLVIDYLSGMTDHFLLAEYQRLSGI